MFVRLQSVVTHTTLFCCTVCVCVCGVKERPSTSLNFFVACDRTRFLLFFIWQKLTPFEKYGSREIIEENHESSTVCSGYNGRSGTRVFFLVLAKSILLIWTYVIVPQYARAMNRVICVRKSSNTFLTGSYSFAIYSQLLSIYYKTLPFVSIRILAAFTDQTGLMVYLQRIFTVFCREIDLTERCLFTANSISVLQFEFNITINPENR